MSWLKKIFKQADKEFRSWPKSKQKAMMSAIKRIKEKR